jgi:preprotein translocase subunit SecY
MVSAAEQLAANLNFSAFAKADALKKRIWFTLGVLLIYRLGTYIPLPGIDPPPGIRFSAPKRAAFSGCSTCSPVAASTGWRSSH